MEFVNNLDREPCSAEETESGFGARIHRSIHGLVHPNLHQAIRMVIISHGGRCVNGAIALSWYNAVQLCGIMSGCR